MHYGEATLSSLMMPRCRWKHLSKLKIRLHKRKRMCKTGEVIVIKTMSVLLSVVNHNTPGWWFHYIDTAHTITKMYPSDIQYITLPGKLRKFLYDRSCVMLSVTTTILRKVNNMHAQMFWNFSQFKMCSHQRYSIKDFGTLHWSSLVWS